MSGGEFDRSAFYKYLCTLLNERDADAAIQTHEVPNLISRITYAITARRREVGLETSGSETDDDSLLVQLTGLRQLCDEIHKSGKATKAQTDQLEDAIFAVSDIIKKNEKLAQWLSQDGHGKPIDWTGIVDLATKLANSLDVRGVQPSTVAIANELREIANDAVTDRKKQLMRRDEWTDGNLAYNPVDTLFEDARAIMNEAVKILLKHSGGYADLKDDFVKLNGGESSRLRKLVAAIRAETGEDDKPRGEAIGSHTDEETVDPYESVRDELSGGSLKLFNFLYNKKQYTYFEELSNAGLFTKDDITDRGIESALQRLIKRLEELAAPFFVESSLKDRRVKLVSKRE